MPKPSPEPLILIVDDDQGLVRLIEKSLGREGFRTQGFHSGQEALAWLSPKPADLILIDLKLPDMDGEEFVRRLRRHSPITPFIVITGQGDEKVAVDMMKQGALDYLVKDIRFQEFVPTIVHRALQQVQRDQKLAAAEAALKTEHQFITAILDTCGALIVALDRQGKVVRFNRACEKTTGYTAQEMIGQAIWDILIPPQERKSVQAVFTGMVEGRFPSHHQNYWITREGQLRFITWSNTVLNDSQGKVEFIIGTGIDITEQKELEHRILQVSENEQRRIGQDLHDGLCQQLAGIEFMSQAHAHKLSLKSIDEAQTADHIAQLIRETISHTRDLAKGLSPVILDPDGLMASLKMLSANITGLFKVKCSFLCPAPVLIQDNTTATHLFRIAQEAVNNALRHGQANQIELQLQSDDSLLVLGVHDNGRGLPDSPADSKGMGLRIMQYRANMIGGSISLHKSPAGGTSVVCSIRSTPPAPDPHEIRKKTKKR